MKIGLINSDPSQTTAIQRALALTPEHTVLWHADSAEAGIALCAQQFPDLVLLELRTPKMGAVEATRRIMAHTPCAILITTDNVGPMATLVFEAMGQGAMDAIDAPRNEASDGMLRTSAFLVKLHTIKQRLFTPRQTDVIHRPPPKASPAAANVLIAIGASAGGPVAIRAVLGGLPKDFAAAIVVIQHIDAQFTQGMADWLGAGTPLTVRICEEGDTPTPGIVLLAGTDHHLTLKSPQRLGYTTEPSGNAYHPSVDVFFSSVARLWRQQAVGVLLTGMGKDGAIGLKALRMAGHHTIVQDQASSAVYGMPKAAIEAGAATEILPLSNIADGLVKALSIRH